jgi:hypothetical protein
VFFLKICLPATNASNESGLTCLNCHRGAHEGVKDSLQLAWTRVRENPQQYEKAGLILRVFHSFVEKVAKT